VNFLVQTELHVQRFILGQLLANVCNLDLQVEVLHFEDVDVELTLLGLDVLLGDSFAEEFTGMEELLEQVASQLP